MFIRKVKTSNNPTDVFVLCVVLGVTSSQKLDLCGAVLGVFAKEQLDRVHQSPFLAGFAACF